LNVKILTAAGVLIALILTGCNRPADPQAGQASSPDSAVNPPAAQAALPSDVPAAMVYDCGDLAITGTFGAGKVDLSFADGRTLTLPLVPSGSGARYADDQGNQLFAKGPEATLTVLGEADRTCATQDVGTLAADTAALGATFRARGNEPGWTAEVQLRDRPSMHVEVDYGNTKLDIAQANEDETGWSGTTSDGTQVALRVERVECLDDMSGEKFEAQAALSVAGEEYRGCGRFKSD
jgi:uncharacterized membrane protein